MPRISSLPGLGQCPGFALLRSGPEDGTSSVASDTGRTVGRIIELWHRGGETGEAFEAAVLQASREAPTEAPHADLDEARTHALGYAQDTRNWNVVLPEYCEQEVKLTLPPAPEDPTGKPVELVGHVDQIRAMRLPNGQRVLRVWDLKNGKPSGIEMLYSYAWQLAAYALACTETLGELVLPGGIIRLRAYAPRTRRTRNKETGELEIPDPQPFFEAPWSLDQCRKMIDNAVQHVAWLRQGLIHLHPGIHCQWCPAGGPHLCGDRIDRLAVLPDTLI